LKINAVPILKMSHTNDNAILKLSHTNDNAVGNYKFTVYSLI